MRQQHKKRLYMVTGKGGVGKTTLSLALCYQLQQSGYKTLLMSFEPSHFLPFLKKYQLRYEELNLMKNAQEYVALKLKSLLVAKAVVNTPFFKAALHMTPGMSYLIYLGTILDRLRNDPDLLVVFDSPSSGHLLMMFDALENFKDIFQSGVIFEDIIKMQELLQQKDFIELIICTHPSLMAMNEAMELREQMKNYPLSAIRMLCNDALSHIPQLKLDQNMPPFLLRKIQLEQEVFATFKGHIDGILPHIPHLEAEKIIRNLAPYLDNI